MDFGPTQQPPTAGQPPSFELPIAAAMPPAPARKKSGWRVFVWIILAISIAGNMFLFLGLIAMAAVLSPGMEMFDGARHEYVEQTLVRGPGSHKIAVINMRGLIDDALRVEVCSQLDAASRDHRVKAVILRTVTPGGTVSASDQIHHEIMKFRQDSGKPVVAFMQSMATSGGYYTSVACDRIVAEPTAITGSIGVLLSNLIVKNLLEQKLGIEPVTIKSGEKKDWGSMFSEMTDEQKQYFRDKLITPAYERFVQLVAEGRQGQLTADEARRLSDGSLYSAQEAMDKKLIDDVGYMDKAVELARSLSGVSEARVVEYQRPLTLSSLLGVRAEPPLRLDRSVLEELAAPRLLYLWDAGN